MRNCIVRNLKLDLVSKQQFNCLLFVAFIYKNLISLMRMEDAQERPLHVNFLNKRPISEILQEYLVKLDSLNKTVRN